MSIYGHHGEIALSLSRDSTIPRCKRCGHVLKYQSRQARPWERAVRTDGTVDDCFCPLCSGYPESVEDRP